MGHVRVVGAPVANPDLNISQKPLVAGDFSVAAQDTAPVGVRFRDDGSRMYVAGSTNGRVNQYNLSTPWDVTTATFQTSYQVAGTTLVGLYFRPDGDMMFTTSSGDQLVRSHTLSTPWDVSTASAGPTQSFGTAYGIHFHPSGSTLYLTKASPITVESRNLVTPWAIDGSSSFTGSVSTPLTSLPHSVTFSPDGQYMVVADRSNDFVQKYRLSSPWAVGSAYLLGLFDAEPRDSSIAACEFGADGSKMYVTGQTGDRVYQYNMP